MEQTMPAREAPRKITTLPMLDVLKFFFCLCIIAQHTKLFGFHEQLFFITSKGIFRLAVPFFFVASGFLLGRKLSGIEDKKAVILMYCKRLLLPFCVFSVINILERAVAMALSKESISYILLHVGQAVVFYPYGALWYVQACIIGALLLLPFLNRNKLNLALALGVVLYLIALLCNNYYGLAVNTGLQRIIDLYMKYCVSPRNGLFVGFLFLAIGIKCGERHEAYYSQSGVLKKNVFLLIGAYALYIAEVILIKRFGTSNDDGSLYIMLPLLAPLIVCVAVGWKLGQNPASAWIQTHSVVLRNLSTGMYFLHRPILTAVTYFVKNGTVQFLIVVPLAAMICLVAYRFPRSFVCRLLK